jgi:hypothetical protein
MALECVIVQPSKKVRPSQDQARDIGWGAGSYILLTERVLPAPPSQDEFDLS